MTSLNDVPGVITAWASQDNVIRLLENSADSLQNRRIVVND